MIDGGSPDVDFGTSAELSSARREWNDAKMPNEPATANVCHFNRTEIPFDSLTSLRNSVFRMDVSRAFAEKWRYQIYRLYGLDE